MVNEEQNTSKKNEVAKEIKVFSVITWLIIPVTLFFPWGANPSDNGGSAFGIVLLGLIVFVIFSIILAKTASSNRYMISGGVRRFAYSPLVFACSMILLIALSFIF